MINNLKNYKGFNVLSEQTSKSLVSQVRSPFFMQYFGTAWLIALIPTYTILKIVMNLFSSKNWKNELLPDLAPIGFTVL